MIRSSLKEFAVGMNELENEKKDKRLHSSHNGDGCKNEAKISGIP